VSKATICPQCHAQLPRTGRFCLECGCDLYEHGVRRPPIHIVPIALLVLAFGGLVTYIVTHESGGKAPPEVQEVTDLTTELLLLAADGEYRAMVTRFYQPDAECYERTDKLLRQIVRGSGVPGLNIFRAACVDDPEEADKFVKKYGVEYRDYVAGLLAALEFQDGALRTKLGAKFGAQRTLDFVAWYLSLVFGPTEPDRAEIATVRWQDGPDGSPLLVVSVRFPKPRDATLSAPVAGVADPARLAWRRVGEGKWALTLGCLESHFRLEEVLQLLQRVKP
jgi:hypothetical protein